MAIGKVLKIEPGKFWKLVNFDEKERIYTFEDYSFKKYVFTYDEFINLLNSKKIIGCGLTTRGERHIDNEYTWLLLISQINDELKTKDIYLTEREIEKIRSLGYFLDDDEIKLMCYRQYTMIDTFTKDDTTNAQIWVEYIREGKNKMKMYINLREEELLYLDYFSLDGKNFKRLENRYKNLKI